MDATCRGCCCAPLSLPAFLPPPNELPTSLSPACEGSEPGPTDPTKWIFENEHIIGNGSFGVVYQATIKDSIPVKVRGLACCCGREDGCSRRFRCRAALTSEWRAA